MAFLAWLGLAVGLGMGNCTEDRGPAIAWRNPPEFHYFCFKYSEPRQNVRMLFIPEPAIGALLKPRSCRSTSRIRLPPIHEKIPYSHARDVAFLSGLSVLIHAYPVSKESLDGHEIPTLSSLLRLSLSLEPIRLVFLHSNDDVSDQHHVGHDCGQTTGERGISFVVQV